MKITDIIVPAERYREGVGDPVEFEKLKNSITKFGLLQPIVVTADGELIAGFRRYTAHVKLGLDYIKTTTPEGITVVSKRKMELEENFQRHAMTWQEEQRAIVDIFRLEMEEDPTRTQATTAAMLDIDQADISRAQTIVKGLAKHPEIAKKADSASQAYKLLMATAKQTVRRVEVASQPQEYANIESSFALGDSVEFIKSLPDGCVDAHITDPPFGIDFDDYSPSLLSNISSYKDTRDLYRRILSMAPDYYRTLKENGWLVFFLGMSWYQEAKETFREAGFTVDEIPLIWNRSEGNTFTTNPEQLFAKGYDIALHAYKGKPTVVKRRHNVFTIHPMMASEKQLLVERPVKLYQEIIEALTIPGETVCDLFAGSGSCPTAAATIGRKFIACEIDPNRRAVALQKIKFNLNPRGV